MRRPLLDLSAQLLPVLSQLVERIFLTGLLVQRLGVGQFERWSLISAIITLLTMIDLGTQITFSNRMSRAAHRGDMKEAIAIFRQSNTIFAGLAIFVIGTTLVFATASPLQYWLGLNPPLSASEQIVAVALGSSIAIKLAMTNLSGVYRAMMAFGRGTLIMTMADLLRIAMGIAALLLVGTMAAFAVTMAVATLMAFLFLIPLDLANRFPLFSWRLARPTDGCTRGALSESLLFASSYLPMVVLTQIPIMLIGSRTAQGALASYVLLRTIANVVRTLAQKVTAIFGMELARFESQGRLDEIAVSYRYLAALVALFFGAGCALLWSWGSALLRIWTGSAGLHDPLLLAIMLAPLIISPGTQLGQALLIYGHRPGSFALALVLQTTSTALFALFLPISSIALRLSVALSLAEILFLAPVIALATHRMVGNIATRSLLPDFLLAAAAAATTIGLSLFVQRFHSGLTAMIVAGLSTAILATPLILYLARGLIRSLAKARAGSLN